MQSPRIVTSPRVARRHRKTSTAVRTLRRAIEQCQELVFVTDVEGTIQYANPACETLTGHTPPELLENNLDQLAVGLPKSEPWRFLRDRALEAGVFRGPLGIRCKNASVAELDLAITVVRDPRAGSTSLVCTGLAIAVQREIPETPERLQAMDPISGMASGVAHDFNNLLMVIGAYAEMGLAAAPTEHALRRNFQEILATVRRASDLTRRLLMIGRRPNKGRQLVSINWIIEDTAAMLSRIMEEDIEVRVSLGRNVGMVRADPGQIEQVLLNLAVNARDAMPDGGQFVIETESVEIEQEFANRYPGLKVGEHVVLTVSDSGQGMRPDQLSRIFEPYYTTKVAGKGTGLGLAIVNSIVQQNSGCILVESQPGAGSKFKVYLPVEAHVGKKREALWHDGAALPRGSESILFVEDSELLRRASEEFLSSRGYNVKVAANSEEALRLLRNNNYIDLIIADVVMPGLCGPDLVKQVTQILPNTRVLFMSGHTEDVMAKKGMRASEPNLLQKPFPLSTLAMRVREVLDKPFGALAAAASSGR